MATSPVSSSSTNFFAVLPPFPWTAPALAEINPEINPVEQQSAPVPSAPVASRSPQPDSAAVREQVLVEHLPLVRLVARKIHERLPQHVELEDLVSAGTVGLIDAYNKFDGSKNVQFRSYAQFRVRGAILDSLRDLDWASRELRRKGRSIEEARQNLTQQMGRAPSQAEIAAELGMDLTKYQELVGELKSLEIGSLNEMRGEDSAEEELAFVPASPDEDPLFRCMQTEMSAHLSAAIRELPEREARVLSMYYVEEMTLKEIGVVLGLVESRVSQIRAAAIINLRARMTRGKKLGAPRIAVMPKRRAPQAVIPAAVVQRSAASSIRGNFAGR